jgi:carboxylesterase type B
MGFIKLCILALPSLAQSSPLSSGQRQDWVQLPTGRYYGLHGPNTSTTTYYGIPYGFSERFQPSKPIELKDGISPKTEVNSTGHSPACVNFNIPPPYDTGFKFLLGPNFPEPQQEDCLNLDVYVPQTKNNEPLPVLVYTPGGGFLVGASFIYDMRDIVNLSVSLGKPVIAVVINYRLGPLGFLNPSALGEDSINVGLTDQFLALKFVSRYIAAFGGDPEKVTIMGQSAGAESAMQQLLWSSDKGHRLFRAAWMASIPSASASFLQSHPIPYKDDRVKEYAEACGCSVNRTIQENVQCLKEADIKTMINASMAWQGSGVGFGGAIKDNVFRAIRAGKFPKVPIVISTCRDEGTSSAIGFNTINDQITSIAVESKSYRCCTRAGSNITL